jgi:hypothetical protein
MVCSFKKMYFIGKKVESFGFCSLFLAVFYGNQSKAYEKWIQMIQIWQVMENLVLFV